MSFSTPEINLLKEAFAAERITEKMDKVKTYPNIANRLGALNLVVHNSRAIYCECNSQPNGMFKYFDRNISASDLLNLIKRARTITK